MRSKGKKNYSSIFEDDVRVDRGLNPFSNNPKTSNIFPFHKRGCLHHVGHFRPISIATPISTLFETVTHDAVNAHLLENNQLSQVQLGLRKSLCWATNQCDYLFIQLFIA